MTRRVVIALLSATVVRAARGDEPTPTHSVWDGVYTDEQASRGAAIYDKECASCHGDHLGGHESAPALTAAHLVSNWNGLPLSDLFERIRLTMPQNTPGKLPSQDYADVLAYVLKFNKFPAGKTKLFRKAEMLRDIVFEGRRVDGKK